MTEIHFSDNYRDLSQEYGVNAGFQFEFYCETCGDRWRTPFQAYHGAQACNWMRKASSLIGGLMGQAADAVETLVQAGFREARDRAFAEAVEAAKAHFHRCAKCRQYVCDKCWNKSRGLCVNCAPDAQVELESAKAHGEACGASEVAMEEGRERGRQMDVSRERQLVCPSCGAQTKGAKFCPECGTKLAVKYQCPSCYKEISLGVKFCPECGHRMR